MAQAGIMMEIGSSIPALHFGKKPFDWMSDSQWQMLLVGHTQLFEGRAYTVIGQLGGSGGGRENFPASPHSLPVKGPHCTSLVFLLSASKATVLPKLF